MKLLTIFLGLIISAQSYAGQRNLFTSCEEKQSNFVVLTVHVDDVLRASSVFTDADTCESQRMLATQKYAAQSKLLAVSICNEFQKTFTTVVEQEDGSIKTTEISGLTKNCTDLQNKFYSSHSL